MRITLTWITAIVVALAVAFASLHGGSIDTAVLSYVLALLLFLTVWVLCLPRTAVLTDKQYASLGVGICIGVLLSLAVGNLLYYFFTGDTLQSHATQVTEAGLDFLTFLRQHDLMQRVGICAGLTVFLLFPITYTCGRLYLWLES